MIKGLTWLKHNVAKDIYDLIRNMLKLDHILMYPQAGVRYGLKHNDTQALKFGLSLLIPKYSSDSFYWCINFNQALDKAIINYSQEAVVEYVKQVPERCSTAILYSFAYPKLVFSLLPHLTISTISNLTALLSDCPESLLPEMVKCCKKFTSLDIVKVNCYCSDARRNLICKLWIM